MELCWLFEFPILWQFMIWYDFLGSSIKNTNYRFRRVIIWPVVFLQYVFSFFSLNVNLKTWETASLRNYAKKAFCSTLYLSLAQNHWLYPLSVYKGQLISKANYKVFIWTKKPTNIFLYFCPSFKKPLKSVRNKR